jgi:AraC family transcriptional regulator
VRHAARLLLETRLPVTEVAFEAGFGDLSNFIRTFRKATGRSPRAFRAGLLGGG